MKIRSDIIKMYKDMPIRTGIIAGPKPRPGMPVPTNRRLAK
jgi:hypothetical protein